MSSIRVIRQPKKKSYLTIYPLPQEEEEKSTVGWIPTPDWSSGRLMNKQRVNMVSPVDPVSICDFFFHSLSFLLPFSRLWPNGSPTNGRPVHNWLTKCSLNGHRFYFLIEIFFFFWVGLCCECQCSFGHGRDYMEVGRKCGSNCARHCLVMYEAC